MCFPLPPREPKDDKEKAEAPPIPQQTDDLKDATKDLYKLNEQKADGGFFPVGPWGETRLWHGGVHLAAKEGSGVFAPFWGRLVAARIGTKTPIGSVNFVLLKHDMTLGATKVQFYSLYMHLRDETGADAPAWMQSPAWKKDGKPGAVVLLDEPVEAGSVIAHVGRAGPDNLSRAQVHVEFFSTAELFTNLPG